MTQKDGTKVIGSKRTMKAAPKIHHGNHNGRVMTKNSPKAMRGLGKC